MTRRRWHVCMPGCAAVDRSYARTLWGAGRLLRRLNEHYVGVAIVPAADAHRPLAIIREDFHRGE